MVRFGCRCRGRATYGWDLDDDGADLHANAVEQQALANMKAMRASGLSYQAIAHALDETGVPTKISSGPWTSKVVRSVLARQGK